MSKEVVSQIVRQTCNACGKVQEWEIAGTNDQAAMLQEMQRWYTVGHKVVDYDGQLIQLTGDACSIECVAPLSVKLALPPAETKREDQIDLASLRTRVN